MKISIVILQCICYILCFNFNLFTTDEDNILKYTSKISFIQSVDDTIGNKLLTCIINNESASQICMINQEKSSYKVLTFDSLTKNHLLFNKKRNSLFYIGGDGREGDIWEINLKNYSIKKITNLGSITTFDFLSEDEIIYAVQSVIWSKIYSFNINKNNPPRMIVAEPHRRFWTQYLKLTKNGQYIIGRRLSTDLAYLFIYDLKYGRFLNTPDYFYDFILAPDDSTIYITSEYELYQGQEGILKYNLKSCTEKSFDSSGIDTMKLYSRMIISSNGDEIAFIGSTISNPSILKDTTTIYVFKPGEDRITNIYTDDKIIDVCNFSPDNKKILFIMEHNNMCSLYSVDMLSKNIVKIFDNVYYDRWLARFGDKYIFLPTTTILK